MNDQDKTKEELIIQLQKLRQENSSLKAEYKKNIAAYKKAEKALIESEEKFKHVFESANVGKSITLPTGEINVNQAFCDMLGYKPEELQKMKWQDITPADEVESVQAQLEPLQKGITTTARFNKRYIHKSGYFVWTDVSVAMQFDAKHNPLYFIATIIDISERKRAEEELQMSEANFRNLADSMHDGIVIAPADGRHIYANRYACELLGYSPEEMLKTTQEDLADPDAYPMLKQRLLDRIEGRQVPTIYEIIIRRKDGTSFPAEVSGTTILWQGQKCYMVLFRDITERKLAEKSLSESEKKWRKLVLTLPDYVALYDRDGKYLFLNHFAEGFSMKDIEGKTYTDLLANESKPIYEQAFITAKQTNSTQYVEHIAFGANSTFRNYESYFVPITEDDEFVNMMVIARDITERKQAEINLQDSEQKYRNLVDNSLVGVLRSKVNGEIIYVNDAIVRMLEFDSREELISAGAYMRYKYPSQRDEFIRILKKDGQVNGFEANVLTQKGNERIFLYSLILDGDTIDGTLIDITDRKRAEKEAIENQQFLKSITSEVQEVIFAIDAQGIFTFSEGKGLQKLGLKPGQIVGMSVFDVYKDFPEVIVGLKEALVGKMVKSESLVVGNLNFSTTYQPIFDENGQLTSVVGLAIDVTEAKNAEKALNEHAIRLQALLELNEMTHQPFDEILDFVLDASQKMTRSEFSFVGMVDPEETELSIHRWSKEVMEQCRIDTGPLSFRVAETGLLCECIRTHQPVFVNNYSANSHLSKKGTPIGHVSVTRMMAVPLIGEGRVTSVISIANKSEDYTMDDALGITSLLNKMMEIKKWQEVEEALQQNKRELATLMNNLPGMVYSCLNDQDWTMKYVSEGVLDLTGYLPDDLIGSKAITFEEIIHPDDRGLVWTTIQAALEKKFSYDLEYRIIEKSGSIKHVWERGQGIFDPNGTLLHLEGFITDITAKKYAEDALQEANDTLESRVLERTVELAKSNKLLDETGRLARVGGWEIDLLTGINYWSEATRIIHEVDSGFDPNLELAINFYAPDSIPVITGLVERLINFGELFDTELELITAKKNRIWVRALGQPFYENGKMVRIGGVFQDITGRKLAEIELKKHREHLEDLVKERTTELKTQYALLNALINSPEDIIIFSLDNKYCYTTFNENHRKEMLKIWKADIQMGSNILDYMSPEIAELTKISIDRALSGEYFTEVQHLPEADIYYEFNWNPILQGNVIVGATVFVKDISERKRSENEVQFKNEELIKLNAEKDKFFSIIAHDLRSPFNSFLGLTQIMAEELPNLTMAQVQEMAVSMSKSASMLYRLLENLLHWSRMQQGAIPFNPETVELGLIVSESIEMIQETAKSKGVEIDTNIPDGLAVFADTNLLQTVIRNLVSNAVKFTSKGGKVNVLARSSDEKNVEISIQDTGIGMSQSMIENLFRIDIQTSRKGTEGEPSTGLGLLLCKEFIEKHGGKLWAESEEGKGSTFHFTLPATQVLL